MNPVRINAQDATRVERRFIDAGNYRHIASFNVTMQRQIVALPDIVAVGSALSRGGHWRATKLCKPARHFRRKVENVLRLAAGCLQIAARRVASPSLRTIGGRSEA